VRSATRSSRWLASSRTSRAGPSSRAVGRVGGTRHVGSDR
jgi:hypothetical protein